MSNLQKPPYSMQYLRLKHPRFWRYVQGRITKVLDHHNPLTEQMIARLGREGTLETLEAMLDAGTMRFIPCPVDPDFFGLAFYCPDGDQYSILAADGTLFDVAPGVLNWLLGEGEDGA